MFHRLALALSFAASAVASEPRLVEVFRAELVHDHAHFGGLSGIEIDPTGGSAWVINDRARMFPISFQRNPDGSLGRYQIGAATALNAPLSDRTIAAWSDTEGLAISESGRVFVSLESPSRLWILNTDWETQFATDFGADINAQLEVTGLEALAIDSSGQLVTIPEWPRRRGDTTFPVIRHMSDTPGWEVVADIPMQGSFKPVGADFGPDGRLYLLERAVSLLGFRSRIRRFDLSQPDLGEELLLETKLGQYDNLEGLAVWTAPDGTLLLSAVSDNNFWTLQRTELVEFALTE